MAEYEIVLQNRESLIIDEEGNVLERHTPEGSRFVWRNRKPRSWRITGGWYHKGFGHMGFITLTGLLQLKEKDLLYKNGKSRYGLTDIDHGSERAQMNNGVWLIKRKEESV